MPGKIYHAATYRYVQASPSASWAIEHGLGGNGSAGVPVIDVFVDYEGSLQKIIPNTVTMVDANNVLIEFTTPYSGYAMIVV